MRSLRVAIVLLTALPPLHAQQPLTTLRFQTREVLLDVVVTDKKGNYVGGLTKNDFTIFEDDTKQKVVFFQSPEMRRISADAPEVKSTADLRKIGNAPVTMLVLDELNTAFTDMAYARSAMEKWLERQPARLTQPTVLLVASDEKFAVIHDFTQDRAALQLALRQHFPSYPFRMSKGGSIGPDAGERMAVSLGTLMQIAQASSGTPGRKNVIWVGVGFPQLLLDDVTGTKEEEIAKAAVRATNSMLNARITLNVIDPTAMADSSLDMNNPDQLSLAALSSTLGPTSSPISGHLNFDTFAPATGGALFFGRNDVDHAIAQAVDNGANYYTVSYSPTNHDESAGRFRNIRVQLRDPNLTATTRTGYFPESQPKLGETPAAPATHDLVFDLTNAALSSVTYNGLSVEAQKSGSAFVLHVGAAELRPHVLANGASMAEVTVMRVCFGSKNKVLSHDPFELQASLGEGVATIDFTVPQQTLPRGTLRMRFVVRDVISAHIGTVDVAIPQ